MRLSNLVKLGLFVLVVTGAATYAFRASAHCEIPCGIYGDDTRITILKEHITTVEKSMKQIVELSAAGDKNYNQIVRWVDNKEAHCNEIQEIVTQYFMTQRVKPLPPDADAAARGKYVKQLTILHHILVFTMKSKQTTDTANTAKLRELVHDFEHVYFDK